MSGPDSEMQMSGEVGDAASKSSSSSSTPSGIGDDGDDITSGVGSTVSDLDCDNLFVDQWLMAVSSAQRQSAENVENIPTRTLATTHRRQSQPHGDPLKFIKTSAVFLAEEARKQIELSEETKVKRQLELEGRASAEIVKEEDTEWQNNLDSWKTRRLSRTLQQKSLGASMEEEMESNVQKMVEADKKAKTFSEIMTERERRKVRGPEVIEQSEEEEEDEKVKPTASDQVRSQVPNGSRKSASESLVASDRRSSSAESPVKERSPGSESLRHSRRSSMQRSKSVDPREHEDREVTITAPRLFVHTAFGFTVDGGREEGRQIVVADILADSPAEKVDLRVGDVILYIDGEFVGDHYIGGAKGLVREAYREDREITLKTRRYVDEVSSSSSSPSVAARIRDKIEAADSPHEDSPPPPPLPSAPPPPPPSSLSAFKDDPVEGAGTGSSLGIRTGAEEVSSPKMFDSSKSPSPQRMNHNENTLLLNEDDDLPQAIPSARTNGGLRGLKALRSLDFGSSDDSPFDLDANQNETPRKAANSICSDEELSDISDATFAELCAEMPGLTREELLQRRRQQQRSMLAWAGSATPSDSVESTPSTPDVVEPDRATTNDAARKLEAEVNAAMMGGGGGGGGGGGRGGDDGGGGTRIPNGRLTDINQNGIPSEERPLQSGRSHDDASQGNNARDHGPQRHHSGDIPRQPSRRDENARFKETLLSDHLNAEEEEMEARRREAERLDKEGKQRRLKKKRDEEERETERRNREELEEKRRAQDEKARERLKEIEEERIREEMRQERLKEEEKRKEERRKEEKMKEVLRMEERSKDEERRREQLKNDSRMPMGEQRIKDQVGPPPVAAKPTHRPAYPKQPEQPSPLDHRPLPVSRAAPKSMIPTSRSQPLAPSRPSAPAVEPADLLQDAFDDEDQESIRLEQNYFQKELDMIESEAEISDRKKIDFLQKQRQRFEEYEFHEREKQLQAEEDRLRREKELLAAEAEKLRREREQMNLLRNQPQLSSSNQSGPVPGPGAPVPSTQPAASPGHASPVDSSPARRKDAAQTSSNKKNSPLAPVTGMRSGEAPEKHWLIEEAERRRIAENAGMSRPLPAFSASPPNSSGSGAPPKPARQFTKDSPSPSASHGSMTNLPTLGSTLPTMPQPHRQPQHQTQPPSSMAQLPPQQQPQQQPHQQPQQPYSNPSHPHYPTPSLLSPPSRMLSGSTPHLPQQPPQHTQPHQHPSLYSGPRPPASYQSPSSSPSRQQQPKTSLPYAAQSLRPASIAGVPPGHPQPFRGPSGAYFPSEAPLPAPGPHRSTQPASQPASQLLSHPAPQQPFHPASRPLSHPPTNPHAHLTAQQPLQPSHTAKSPLSYPTNHPASQPANNAPSPYVDHPSPSSSYPPVPPHSVKPHVPASHFQSPIYETPPAPSGSDSSLPLSSSSEAPLSATPTSSQGTPFSRNSVTPGSGDAIQEPLAVSGKQGCAFCGLELGRGAAMVIESLQLFYHLNCFRCCVCHISLGSGSRGADVRVRGNKLHCALCYSNDEGLKFSQV